MSEAMGFEAWPKIPRLSKTMVVTEKIDGTNAAVCIRELAPNERAREFEIATRVYPEDGEPVDYAVFAQSRKRIITPTDDNFGFARWVWQEAPYLAACLGAGRHFGEWWGAGIQRGYDLDHKRFSLFNTGRWSDDELGDASDLIGLHVVPVLRIHDSLDTTVVDDCIHDLVEHGSRAQFGFMQPEGVIVYHSAAGQLYKRLIENDDRPKSAVGA